jgi:hypothetical protein
MEQSPSWEADSHSASQEIPCFIWNPKIYYRIYKSPPLDPPWARWFQFIFHTLFP